jgi:hypothetical protein
MRIWLTVALVVAACAVGALVAWGPGDDSRSLEDPSAVEEKERTRPIARWPGKGHELARVRHGGRVEVFGRPGGKVIERLGARTSFGSPRVLPVVEPHRRWLGIGAPELGNGVVGWVRYDPRALRLEDTRFSLEVDLSERLIELRRGANVERRVIVSVGRFGSGTPPGRFAVTDRIVRGLNPVYGVGAIALSARQPNLPPGWIGGDRIAIHGWSGPVGDAASSGCLRATNADVQALLELVPLGTPVFIRT